jgi:hypothetical protein
MKKTRSVPFYNLAVVLFAVYRQEVERVKVLRQDACASYVR